MNEDLDLFENLIFTSLSNVDESYYATTYKNVESFRAAFGFRAGAHRGKDFAKYGERVFCYEFYHQLRILIDDERQNRNPNFLGEAKLQGEVDKFKVIELIEKLGLIPLDSEYIPDFLMHTPDNADFHPYVIEVKSDEQIPWKKVFYDLQKIDQFIARYQYQRGMFIMVNGNDEYLDYIINKNRKKILELAGHERIKIVCKSNQHTKPIIWQL